MPSRVNLLGLSLEQLAEEFTASGLSVLDAKRVFPWIHSKLASSFDMMSDVPLSVRKVMCERYSVSLPKCIEKQESIDGTQKALLELEDGCHIETVWIPEERRITTCVSSQVGCILGCKFCHTGMQKFVRNLTSSEIIAQIFFWNSITGRKTTNVVFMGMGEPLLNFDNVSNVLRLLLDRKNHNFSRNKITVSTAGIVDDTLMQLAVFGVKLAISLHASNDEKRSSLMPINRKYCIKMLLEAAKTYCKTSNTDCVTFEYILLRGMNDTASDAAELCKLLRSIPCKVNLIMMNCWPGSPFASSDSRRANDFSAQLLLNGIRTTIRKPKGEDILAACGQLNSSKL
ncbi:MAG: 23S rRNA (adenine(2503)-C(2))-methyltransferase RlmN [Holosporaceae bacterium]|nr:23S rRNA (adenine(2503)-C(2))-methyltransferase RlmN [Holosporaceae bacterium]